jgi:HD-GYP domain-containing protein (c-di-GMP phosphodiesterase class II)
MQVYVAAIADVLDLSSEERDELACAADLIEPVRGDPSGIKGFQWGRAHVPGAAMLALHAGERWAGTGWPAGLPADAIPYGSRILAVAQAWTDLTAKGTPELSQAEAMLALSAQTDTDFDPAIVNAALRVVADEAGFAQVPNFQPKLHEIHLPRVVRRGALPAMMPRLVDSSVH